MPDDAAFTALLGSLREADTREKRSFGPPLGGIFARWRRATAPSGSFARNATGLERLLFGAGATAVPVGAGYLAGEELGLWDRLRQPPGEVVQDAGAELGGDLSTYATAHPNTLAAKPLNSWR